MSNLPTHSEVKTALTTIVAEGNGGFGLHMWATVVNRDGEVSTVAFSEILGSGDENKLLSKK